MNRFRRLMVALKGSEADAGLIRYAAMLARLRTAGEVRFVHVLPNGTPDSPQPGPDEARRRLERQIAESFSDVPGSVEVGHEVLEGPPIDRLLAFAAEQEVDLALVGHRPDHPPGRGSLVRRLAMKAPCSVWIVPEGSAPGVKKILVPVDFSEPSADALKVALSMARLVGDAECLALHVYSNDAVLAYEEDDPIIRGEEKEAYERFVAPIDRQGVKVTPLFVEGVNVARTIHRVASEESVDLKVMATRGRSRSAAVLLGSVAEGVIIEARTPVLVVKHFGARLGLLRLLLDHTLQPQHGSPHF